MIRAYSVADDQLQKAKTYTLPYGNDELEFTKFECVENPQTSTHNEGYAYFKRKIPNTKPEQKYDVFAAYEHVE